MTTLELVAPAVIKNILYATDFSPYSNAALPLALAMTHQHKAKLYAVHVLTPDSYLLFASPESWPAILESGEPELQRNAERLEAQLRGVPHQVLRLTGDISEVIFRVVRENQIDMMVLGTHGRTGVRRMLMGSAAEKIFRQSFIPVLTVGPNVSPQKTVAEVNRVLFATDFSPESLAALPHAISIAHEHHARLAVLHVLVEPGTEAYNPETKTGVALRRLKELVPAELGLLFEPEFAVGFGDPSEVILRFASERSSDLIVLGIRPPRASGTSLTHFANTTVQKIVSHAHCPVVTVRG